MVFIVTHKNTVLCRDALERQGFRSLTKEMYSRLSQECSDITYFENGERGPVQSGTTRGDEAFEMPTAQPQMEILRTLYLKTNVTVFKENNADFDCNSIEAIKETGVIERMLEQLGDFYLLKPYEEALSQLKSCVSAGSFWRTLRAITARKVADISDIVSDTLRDVLAEGRIPLRLEQEAKSRLLRKQIAVLGIGVDNPAEKRKKFYRATESAEALTQLEALTGLDMAQLCTSEVTIKASTYNYILKTSGDFRSLLKSSKHASMNCEVFALTGLLSVATVGDNTNALGYLLCDKVTEAILRVREEFDPVATMTLPMPSVTYSTNYI